MSNQIRSGAVVSGDHDTDCGQLGLQGYAVTDPAVNVVRRADLPLAPGAVAAGTGMMLDVPEHVLRTQLRTVEDVSKFFISIMRNGDVPPFKYVCCAKVNTGYEFRPYDIAVVPRGSQPPEHYVVSPMAVVHVSPAHGGVVEVTPVEEWLREEALFDKLRRLSFFRDYLKLKALRAWRRNISILRFHLARARLGKRLFIARSTFAAATAEARRIAFGLRLVQASNSTGKLPSGPPAMPSAAARKTDHGHPQDASESHTELEIAMLGGHRHPMRLFHYPEVRAQWGLTPDQFAAQQRSHIAAAVGVIQCGVDRMANVVAPIVEAVASRAALPDFDSVEALERYVAQNSHVVGPAIGTVAQHERAVERQQRKREMKRRLVEYDLLLPWVRLLDYMVLEESFLNVTSSTSTLALHLDLPGRGHHRELRLGIEVEIAHRGTFPAEFNPPEEAVRRLLRDSVRHAADRVARVPRLVERREFRVHFASGPQPRPLSAIIDHDAPHLAVLSRVDTIVARDFAEAAERAKGYEPCRAVQRLVKEEWPTEHQEWMQRVTEKIGSETILTDVDIKRAIGRITRARQDLNKMQSRHAGTLSIHIARLVQTLVTELDGVTQNVKQMLLQLANRRVNESAKELDAHIALLKYPGPELRHYADWLERCERVDTALKGLMSDAAEVDNLYAIADDNNFEVPQLQKDKRDRTVGQGKGGELPLKMQLTEAVAAAKQHHEQHSPEMKHALNVAIADKAGVLDSIKHDLLHGEYRSAAHSSNLIITKLQGVQNSLQSLQSQTKQIDHWCDLLGVQAPAWDAMREATQAYDAKQDLWATVAHWEERRAYWNRTPVSALDGPKMKEEMMDLFQKAHKLNKSDPDSVTDRLLTAIQAEKEHIHVMVELCNPALKDEHWTKIFDGMSKRALLPEARTLEALRTAGAYQQRTLIDNVSSVATGEYSLVLQLQKIAAFWEETPFILATNKNAKEGEHILGGVEDIMQALEDQQVQVQTCMASRYVAGIKDYVEEWDTKLATIVEALNEWLNVQKSWIYLEFIFSSDDIKKQLPEESRMFAAVDKIFRTLMANTTADNNVARMCLEEGLVDKLKQANENLDKVQKRLEDYLETKRVAFPRFYFLSNDELLSILSDVRNPLAVQPHLQKCFDNIKELEFEGTQVILSMKSTEGEVVPFSERIKVAGNVEHWLSDIERMMRRTLYDITKDAVEAYPNSKRTEWFFDFPAQVVGCVDQIQWTAEMEEVWVKMGRGQSNALVEYLDFYCKQIMETVELVKGSLTKLQRTCCCTLIVVDVHARDVVASLIDEGCAATENFGWQRQLRYYWMQNPADEKSRVDCHIHHSAARILYGYEYLGNQLRLVITPLTERAFLTCTGALHMNQGAAPQGPAGTGKTESVKDLGKALARQVVVFNCSDGLNYKMMSQMFAGLAQAGAWACFDEFNRIEIEVLSVVAQQMLEITTAIANDKDNMIFDGHRIRLNKNFGVFITMNPGYAGRTELPDNLKALFRPICMMIPDYALIAEIMFFSEGFADARTLAQKMVRLYSLSSQQLSKQDHYDFGMRAVKSILVMAGALKRAEPEHAEDMILIRAMRDSNVPKFLRDDTTLFLALITDLFPSVDIKEVINERLRKEIEDVLVSQGCQVVDGFVGKILQLYETMVVRHGVMLVGQTLTGKTRAATTLADALTSLFDQGVEAEHDAHKRFFHKTSIQRLNPKAISMAEMYGDINRTTREWQDGVLSNIVRDLVKSTLPDRFWVCFDGPVDAIWIENMNTVLDDNKLLCLVNGERIKIPDIISIMFEVQDLRHASPATVSRCGMVYMEEYYLDGGWRPIAKSISQRYAEDKELHGRWKHDRAMQLMEICIPSAAAFYRTEGHEYIVTVDQQLVINLLSLLYAFLLRQDEDDTGDHVQNNDENKKRIPTAPPDAHLLFDMLFAQSFIWSFGSNLSDKARGKFSQLARKTLTEGMHIVYPEEGGVFDYFVHKTGLQWVPWTYKVPKFEFDRDKPFFELLVQTTDTVSLRHILSHLAYVGKHVLVNGVTGTGKSSAVGNFLVEELGTEQQDGKFASIAMTFSAQTSSKNLQETIEAKTVKRRGEKEIGPPMGKRMVLLVDDCNMPQLETYGASPPIELLRQMISQGGFYDRKKLTWRDVIDTAIFACCGEPGGGKNELTLRLSSQFHCICISEMSVPSMQTIFNGILGGYLNACEFAPDVVETSAGLVNATITVYERIAKEMLPTPEKTHYTFNLRDVSKVVQGLLQLKQTSTTTASDIIGAWVHESTRVFADRLINETDCGWWGRCACETIEKFFPGTPFDEAWTSTLFGAWADPKTDEYKPIRDHALLHQVLAEAQHDFQVTQMKDTELVLFDDAVAHLARLCRILSQPRGNALLVGVGGSGRHSLCELASHVCNMDCRSIVIVRNYGVAEFREDIKKILLDAGASNKELSFLFSDTQIVHSQFLEDINNLLNGGEVPGIMGSEEMDRIMQSTRDAVRAAGKPETRGAMYQFFVSRCRDNLHVIMCMSPVGAQFRDRLRMFPSLVNCMTIDWYLPWPEQALLSVARKLLGPMTIGHDVKEKVCKVAVKMHLTVKKASDVMYNSLRRRNYTTPTSYLSLLRSYEGMYQEQQEQISNEMKRYRAGLDALDSTNTVVEQLKAKIREMQPSLAKASKDAEEKAAQLIVEKSEADSVKAEVAEEEASARELMDEAQSIQQECQDRLDVAMPALRAALSALDILAKKDIDEVKSFAKPPANVEKTMDAVLLLMKEGEGWGSAKLLLSKLDFLQRLRDYDKENIPALTIRKLKRFMDDKDFVPDVIGTTSAPCRSLCMWVHAMYKFYNVNKEIQPLRDRLGVAEGKVQVARADLDVKQARLRSIVAKIDALEAAARETEEQKATLEAQIVEAQAKLGRADQLISGLAGEKIRWGQQLEVLGRQQKNVVGSMILAAGCVAYVAPFTADFRSQLVAEWTAYCKELSLPVDEIFSLENITDQFTVREWVLKTLPNDTFSIQNATVLKRSSRWCFMVDPQGQANQFIRHLYAKRLKVLKLSDGNYMRSLESAIQVGQPVLIENVGEELDAALDPVLLKQYTKQGTRYILKLGEKEVDYDPEFKLFITTKLSNPSLAPELQIKVTVVNFTVTRSGLEDQQLADVVGVERSDLQERSDQCVVDIAEGKAKIKKLEDEILKMLSEATGDILDNLKLIETLGQSKHTSEAIAKDLVEVERTNVEIEGAREKYRILATRGSIIYGVVAELSNVDPMYQYSLQFFKKLFVNTIGKAPHEEEETTEQRIAVLIAAVTMTSYNVICRGLFEKDKLLLSFLLTTAFLRHDGNIKSEEWNIFLRGSAGQAPSASFPSQPDGFSAKQWQEVAALIEHMPQAFRDVPGKIATQREAWVAWVADEQLFDKSPPGMEDLSDWHRLLIVRALRPEKALFAMRRVVGKHLGREYTESPQFSLGEAFADSTSMVPLIFVLSAGTDPTILFTNFAEETGYGEKKLMLSLGQDQGKRAAAMIEEGRREGWWVYLQNCHVYVSWMSALERIVEQLRPETTHPEFRLWLTSKPSAAFPVPVLQSGMKLTREPPRGLRANMKDSVHALDAAVWGEFDEEPVREVQWKRLLVSLCFFHASVQERRKFGALGWNIAYEWSNPDLDASVKTLRIALSDFKELSWPLLQYSIGVLNYGGRVTDFLDSRSLQVIMSRFFAPQVLHPGATFDDGVGQYKPLDPCPKESLAEYVDQLPVFEPPELFGLHSNANITYQAKESGQLLNAIVDLQPRGGGGGEDNSDGDVMAIARDLIDRMPANIDASDCHDDTFKLGPNAVMNSLGTFLMQEIDQFNRLLGVMHRSLRDLVRAIKGEVVMSATAEAMYAAFLFNQVPPNWKKDGYLCLKPLASYFNDLLDRVAFMRKWCRNGPPASFWLPGFFFPQGFVTCVFQTHSRKHTMPIDTIKFKFTIIDSPAASLTQGPSSGVYVHGFFLEGAGWDTKRHCVRESAPGQLFVSLPVIHLDPINIQEPDAENTYECPLYKASTRAGQLSTTGLSTNFLMKVLLPTGDAPGDHWIRRGVAALCMLDD